MGQGVSLPGENKFCQSVTRKFWLKAQRTLNNTLKCVWHVNWSPFLAVQTSNSELLLQLCEVVVGGGCRCISFIALPLDV